jgi:phenylalanyl-tRNA synthetase beta chain
VPTIEIELEDLESLIGIDLPRDEEQLNDILAYVKGEVKNVESKETRIELKDSNRADIWGVEGLARALKGFLNLEKGLKEYRIAGDSSVEVKVESKLRNIRPYIGCAVLKGVKLTDAAIRQMMHFQDKMDQSYGRNRRRTSIGLYDFDLISPPLRYGVAKPKEVSFVPLEFTEKLTLKEILERHPKGIEYGHIVRKHPVWPIFMDSEDKVLSFPPIINSNDLGRITPETENMLVEVTGTAYNTVLNTLTNITLALADRGGRIFSARIHYPYKDINDVTTPDLKADTMKLDVNYVQKVTGLHLDTAQIQELLSKARYGVAKAARSTVTVKIPCYRVDVLHPVDIVEDIAVAYNYNKIQPRWPQLLTIGGLSADTEFCDLVRELMVGLGFQETLTYVMTNPEVLFTKMNLKLQKIVDVANPKLAFMTCLRNWLVPSLIEFLSHNTHVEYPQKVFEVGYCILHDEESENRTKEIQELACVMMHSNANFSEAKSVFDALLLNLGLSYELQETEHESFIKGRTGKIILGNQEVGLIGEIHPQVLQNWGLENPVAAFEISLDSIRH